MKLDRPIRRLLPDCAETTIADAGRDARPRRACAARPALRGHQLRAHARRPRDDRPAAPGRSAPTSDTAMLVAPAHPRRRGDDRRRDDARRALRAGGRRPGQAPAARARGPAARPADGDRLRPARPPWDAPLFTEGHGRVLIATQSDEDPPETDDVGASAAPPRGRSTSPRCWPHLREERGRARRVLCEGGPRLHGQLVAGGLVDELFVTHAPKLGGGVGPGPDLRARGGRTPARRRLAALASPRPASCSGATWIDARDRAARQDRPLAGEPRLQHAGRPVEAPAVAAERLPVQLEPRTGRTGASASRATPRGRSCGGACRRSRASTAVASVDRSARRVEARPAAPAREREQPQSVGALGERSTPLRVAVRRQRVDPRRQQREDRAGADQQRQLVERRRHRDRRDRRAARGRGARRDLPEPAR